MKHIYCGGEGETMFSTSDIGWVVGPQLHHLRPLIAGMATIMYEGTPLRPDPGIWWQIVEKYKVTVMFSAPTAARVLKKQDPAYMHKYDLSSLKHIFMAGEPLDQPTHEWFMNELQKPGHRQLLADRNRLAHAGCRPASKDPDQVRFAELPGLWLQPQDLPRGRFGLRPQRKRASSVIPPLPPGCLSTVWGQDDRFVSTYFNLFKDPLVLFVHDWAIRDDDGYFTILGRTDDVINVAGHRPRHPRNRRRSRPTPPSPKSPWSASRTS